MPYTHGRRSTSPTDCVGEYLVDYSLLTPEEIAAPFPGEAELWARSSPVTPSEPLPMPSKLHDRVRLNARGRQKYPGNENAIATIIATKTEVATGRLVEVFALWDGQKTHVRFDPQLLELLPTSEDMGREAL